MTGTQKLPRSQGRPQGAQISFEQSFMPGPAYAFHASSPKVDTAKIVGTRAHEIAGIQIPLLSAKVTQLHTDYQEDIQTVQPLCNELSEYCNKFEGVFIGVDDDFRQNFKIRFDVNIIDRRKHSKFSSLATEFEECISELLKTWSAFFTTDLARITEDIKERVVRLKNIPSPESPDGNRRVTEWAGVLNGYLADIKTSEDAISDKTYRQLKIRLEKLADQIRKYCDKHLDLQSDSSPRATLSLSEGELRLISELNAVLAANRLRHRTSSSQYSEGVDVRSARGTLEPPHPPKGNFWEYKYLVLEIEYQVFFLEPRIGEFLDENFVPSAESITNPGAFVEERLAVMRRSFQDASQHSINEKLILALGPKGKPGDPEKLRSFVEEQMARVSLILESANALLCAAVGPDWAPVFRAVGYYPRQMLGNFAPALRTFCTELTARIDALEAGSPAASSGNVNLSWSINPAEEDQNAFNIAIELLRNRRELLRARYLE